MQRQLADSDLRVKAAFKENDKLKEHQDKIKERMEMLRKVNRRMQKEKDDEVAQKRVFELESSIGLFVEQFQLQTEALRVCGEKLDEKESENYQLIEDLTTHRNTLKQQNEQILSLQKTKEDANCMNALLKRLDD